MGNLYIEQILFHDNCRVINYISLSESLQALLNEVRHHFGFAKCQGRENVQTRSYMFYFVS